MEPLEFRSVTDLEEVTALSDDDSLLLVSNGTAKQIKKTNAKLGGGATTIYHVDETAGQSANGGIAVQATAGPATLNLLDVDDNAVTAQQVYDAFMSGRVLIALAGYYYTEILSVEIYGTAEQVAGLLVVCTNGTLLTKYVIGVVGE